MNWDDYLNEKLKQPEFKVAYDALENEDSEVRQKLEKELKNSVPLKTKFFVGNLVVKKKRTLKR